MLGKLKGKIALSDLNMVMKAAGKDITESNNNLSEMVLFSLFLKLKRILPQILSHYLQELLRFQSIQSQEQVAS